MTDEADSANEQLPPGNPSLRVDAWRPEPFPAFAAVAGTGGWTSGYERDLWEGLPGSPGETWVQTRSSDIGGPWGEGDAKDNWLTNPAVDIDDGGIAATFSSSIDGTLGLVLGEHSNTLLLLLVSERRATPRPCVR